MYNGHNLVRFVRVTNRSTRTLTSIINRYCVPGSVIHLNGEQKGAGSVVNYNENACMLNEKCPLKM